MAFSLLAIFGGIILLNSTKANSTSDWGHFHQNDYDVKMERMDIEQYDHSMINDMRGELVFLNRTQKAINISWYQLTDLSNNLMLDLQVYKFSSNEYRFFPITLSLNVSREYENNNFNIQGILRRVSNICFPIKKGFRYLRNFVPKYSKLPPYMVRGSFKIEAKFAWESKPRAIMNFYGSVADKPLKWNK